MVPRLENPALSAARAQSVSSLPDVPGTAFGRPIPTSILLLSVRPILAPSGGTRSKQAPTLGHRPPRPRAGRPPRSARRGGPAAGASSDLRDRWGADLE